jgi:hypothetical protein
MFFPTALVKGEVVVPPSHASMDGIPLRAMVRYRFQLLLSYQNTLFL